MLFRSPKQIGPGLFARVVANDNGFVALAWERFMGNARSDTTKQTGFAYSTDYGFTFSKDSALSATGSKLGLVQFTGSNEITASWFNVNNGGTVVAKRAVLGNTVSVRFAEPQSFSLFPNPAQNLVTVNFTLPQSQRVSLKVFNVLGQEIATILDETLPAGEYVKSLNIGQWSLMNQTLFVQLKAQHSTLNTIPLQVLR